MKPGTFTHLKTVKMEFDEQFLFEFRENPV